MACQSVWDTGRDSTVTYGLRDVSSYNDPAGNPSRGAIWGSTPLTHVFLSRSCGSGNMRQTAQLACARFSPAVWEDLPQPASVMHTRVRTRRHRTTDGGANMDSTVGGARRARWLSVP